MRKTIKVIAVPTLIPVTGLIFTETAHGTLVAKPPQIGRRQPVQHPSQPHHDEQQAEGPPRNWPPTPPASGGVHNTEITIVGSPTGRFTYEVPGTIIRGTVRVIEWEFWEVEV